MCYGSDIVTNTMHNAAPGQAGRSPWAYRTASAVSVVAIVCALAGCASLGPDSARAHTVVNAFFHALTTDDGLAACAQLTETAQESVQEQTGTNCANGILGLGLTAEPSEMTVEIYSRAAFVTGNNTTLFLTVGHGDWLIRAAGCTATTAASYECVVDGS